MNADEIIQNREWQDLSEEERSEIFELASNEQEFYLLKRMLNVSSEEIFDIPEVNPDVKNNIINSIKRKKHFKVLRNWYLAAASVIAFGFLTFILIQDKNKNELVKENVEMVNPKNGDAEILSIDSAKNSIVKNKVEKNNFNKEKISELKYEKVNPKISLERSLAINDKIKKSTVADDFKDKSYSEESPKMQSSIVIAKSELSEAVAKKSYASNNSVGQNKELLNFVTEIF